MDTLVLALGNQSNTEFESQLEIKLKDDGYSVYKVGDNVNAGNLLYTIHSAFYAALKCVKDGTRADTDILAYGQCVMVALYAVYVFTVLLHLPIPLSSILAVTVSALLALLIHVAVVKPLLKAPLINRLLALAGVIIVLENIILAVFGSDYLGLQISFPVFSVSNIYIKISSLIPFVAGIITLSLLWLFLTKTYTGLAIKAVVQDREMAGFTLTAFVIVVLGGLGNLLGGFIAAFLIGIVSQVTGVIFSSEIGEILVYGIFILFILFRPQGFLGVKVKA